MDRVAGGDGDGLDELEAELAASAESTTPGNGNEAA